jgi:hypothetical protein
MARKSFAALSMLSASLLTAGVSHADIVSVEFTGHITSVARQDVPEPFGILNVGQAYRAFLEYQTDTPDSNTEPHIGTYLASVLSFSVTVGETTLSYVPPLGTPFDPGSWIHVTDDNYVGSGFVEDSIFISASNGRDGPWRYFTEIGLGSGQNAISSTDLYYFGTLRPWVERNFRFSGCDLTGTPYDCFDFRADIDTMVSSVPLPAAAWLFAPALGLLGLRRRQRPTAWSIKRRCTAG